MHLRGGGRAVGVITSGRGAVACEGAWPGARPDGSLGGVRRGRLGGERGGQRGAVVALPPPAVIEGDLTNHDPGVTTSAPAATADDAAASAGESDGAEGDPVDALASWMEKLKIKLPIARAYAEALTEDGFDSIDALETVEEAELIEYGVKKGHARLILKALSGR